MSGEDSDGCKPLLRRVVFGPEHAADGRNLAGKMGDFLEKSTVLLDFCDGCFQT